ncbi:hypothetical protein V6S67_08035 [Arthrobacter sp. Soc17.1.1.1]|uniref:hypothetical protein n=1 Tax=Arthrobacter sp. Soc17.1.1.1 TaxID=3121277 RepID=UPI002FE44352
MKRGLQFTQYALVLTVAALIILIIWFPANWLQLLLTAVVLLIAAAAISNAREQEMLRGHLIRAEGRN